MSYYGSIRRTPKARQHGKILPRHRLRPWSTCPRCGAMRGVWLTHTYRRHGRWLVSPAGGSGGRRAWNNDRPTVRIRRKKRHCQHPFHAQPGPSY